MPDGPVGLRCHDAVVEGRASQPRRLEQQLPSNFGERPAGDFLEDETGQVDPEVGVLEVVAHREAQPGIRYGPAVGGKRPAAHPVVGAFGCLMGEAHGVAEQVAERDPASGWSSKTLFTLKAGR